MGEKNTMRCPYDREGVLMIVHSNGRSYGKCMLANHAPEEYESRTEFLKLYRCPLDCRYIHGARVPEYSEL